MSATFSDSERDPSLGRKACQAVEHFSTVTMPIDAVDSRGRREIIRLRHIHRKRWFEFPDVETLSWRKLMAFLMLGGLASFTFFGLFIIVAGLPETGAISLHSVIQEIFGAHDHRYH